MYMCYVHVHVYVHVYANTYVQCTRTCKYMHNVRFMYMYVVHRMHYVYEYVS